MKLRGLIYALAVLAIIALVFLVLAFGVSPPATPSENTIAFGNTEWSLDSNPRFYGKTVWARFADYSGNLTIDQLNTIKVEHEIYLGAIPYDSEAMTWEVNTGSYSSHSLTYNDLTDHWQGSKSIFTFKHGDTLLTVTFSIPKLTDGTNKYPTLLESWEAGELYQTIE